MEALQLDGSFELTFMFKTAQERGLLFYMFDTPNQVKIQPRPWGQTSTLWPNFNPVAKLQPCGQTSTLWPNFTPGVKLHT
jgi:hypothetical protein